MENGGGRLRINPPVRDKSSSLRVRTRATTVARSAPNNDNTRRGRVLSLLGATGRFQNFFLGKIQNTP